MTHNDSAAEPTVVTDATDAAAQGSTVSPATPATRAGTETSRLDMVAWAVHRIERRRSRISAEIARNRRGEPAVPTWVLTVVLVVILAAWAALVLLS